MATTTNYGFKKRALGHPVRDDDIGANLDMIDTAIASSPSAATFVVAASDSLHKERADYVCDGVDDQVEIQAVIDALPATGGKIVLLDGRFVLTDEILMNKDGCWITGNTATQIDLDHSGGRVPSAIEIVANHIVISNINFEFTDTTVLTTPPRAIHPYSENVKYCHVDIHNCRFIGIETSGISGGLKHTTIAKCIEGGVGKHWHIHNNYFKGCSWEGVSIGNEAFNKYPEHAIITQNTIVGLGDDRCYGGIVVEHGARHCIIANNVITNMSLPGYGYGIYVIGGEGLPGSQDIVVTGNSCNRVRYGISIKESIGVTCTGNSIKNAYTTGINIGSKSRHILVSGNVLTNTGMGIYANRCEDVHANSNLITGSSMAIAFREVSNFFVNGNSLSYATAFAVGQVASEGDPYVSYNVDIRNNVLKNANTNDGSYSHIYIHGTVEDLTVWGNVFRDTQAEDTTTLDAEASIGDSVITVVDVRPFSYNEAIELGADIMRITEINYYDKTITFTPVLGNNHIVGSAVSGKDTSYRPMNAATIACMNNWEGMTLNPSTSFEISAGNIGVEGTFFLGDGETKTFKKTINYDDASLVHVCKVRDGHAITDVWVEVVTTFDDVGAKLKIGDGNNILGFLCSADGTNNVIDLTSVGYYGVNDDQREAYLWDNINSHRIQKVYTTGDTIDCTITKTDGSQGQAIVYVKITRIGG